MKRLHAVASPVGRVRGAAAGLLRRLGLAADARQRPPRAGGDPAPVDRTWRRTSRGTRSLMARGGPERRRGPRAVRQADGGKPERGGLSAVARRQYRGAGGAAGAPKRAPGRPGRRSAGCWPGDTCRAGRRSARRSGMQRCSARPACSRRP